MSKLVAPEVKNAGGEMGTFPLEDRERMWRADEDKDMEGTENTLEFKSFNGTTNPMQDFWRQRHSLPDTYNKPFEFEPGFNWRAADQASTPYEWGDPDNDPYQHSSKTWRDNSTAL